MIIYCMFLNLLSAVLPFYLSLVLYSDIRIRYIFYIQGYRALNPLRTKCGIVVFAMWILQYGFCSGRVHIAS